MSTINLWQLLAGLGLFLFAMKQLEQALASLGSSGFRQLLRRHTRTRISAIASGTLATTLVQSSSLVGLFTLALAGAGMLELRNAVGIILGANLGTTVTGWLVATLGFKLSLGQLSLPLIAVGSLGMTLLPQRRPGWRFVFAIGLLLFGLDFMKGSLESLQSELDIDTLRALHPLLIFLIGALFTAVIQSSSGTMVITLGALNAGILDLPQAAALIIGADLGTTSTLILGGLPGSQLQRQIAAAHFLFNVITDLLAIAALPLLLLLVAHVYHLQNYPLLSLVAIHSSFNVVGILLFLPFIDRFAAILQRLFPRRDDLPLQAIPAQATDIAVEALEQATRRLLETVIDLNRHCFHLPERRAVTHYADAYDDLKVRELDILMLAQRIQQKGVAREQTARLSRSAQATREALMAAKEIKDIREGLITLRHHGAAPIQAIDQSTRQTQKRIYQQLGRILEHPHSESSQEALATMEQVIRDQHEALHQAILPLVADDDLQSMSSTLLNINRELYLSNQSLYAACRVLAENPQPASGR